MSDKPASRKPPPPPDFDENPEWTEEDFRKAWKGDQIPADIRNAFPRMRGPQKAPTKIPISIRLSAEVVQHFRATGPGWQGRIDDVLRKAMMRKARG